MGVRRAGTITAIGGTTALCGAIALVIGAAGAGAAPDGAQGGPGGTAPAAIKGWQKGKGWGWIWGKDDEVGALNAMTDASRAAALALATRGETFDLGMTYSRRSYKWPGHSPGEIITFRSPDGIARMQDADAPPAASNTDRVFWHSAALFMSDNVATQIDGLAHITAGADDHWYNGFKESEWGGDWGPRKCDASTIPPIVARGVLIDVAAFKKVDALPGHTVITTQDLKDTLAWEGATLQPGDVVLVRTGTGRYWGEDGADHARIGAHDSAGPDLAATKWLVEDQGAMMVGSDTSGYEVSPAPGKPEKRSQARLSDPIDRKLVVDQAKALGKKIASQRKDMDKSKFAEAEKLLAEIEKAADALSKAPPAQKDKALVELNKLTDAVKDRQKRLGSPEQINRQLQQLKDMAGNGPADDFARDMARGDFEKAASEPKGTIIPVHRYLLVDQGVHLGELHYLEGLSKAKSYVFCYVAATSKIKGTAAGFALRPLAIR